MSQNIQYINRYFLNIHDLILAAFPFIQINTLQINHLFSEVNIELPYQHI